MAPKFMSFLKTSSLILLSCSALATTVSFDHPHTLSIFLRVNQPSQIEDIRQAVCPPGTLNIHIPSLPHQISEPSLLIKGYAEKPLSIHNTALHSLNLDYADMTKKFMGQPITLIQPQSNGEDTYRPAQLVGMTKEQRPIVYHDGVLDFDYAGRIGFNMPAPSTTLPYLQLLIDNPNQQLCRFSLNYLCPLLFWQAHYLVEIDLDKNQLSIQGVLKLHNLTGVAFKDANIFWVPHVKDKSPQIKPPTPHSLATKVHLPANSPQTLPFLYTQAEPTITYHLDMPHDLYTYQENQQILIRRHFSLAHLDLRHIPDGVMNVYLHHAKAPPLHFATHRLKKNHPHRLDIILDETSEGYAQLKQIQTRALNNQYQEITYYLEITNDSPKDLPLRLNQPLFAGWKFARAYHEPILHHKNQVSWILNIPAKDQVSFWYRLVIPAIPE